MNEIKNREDQPGANQTLEQFSAKQYATAIRYVRSKIPEQDAHDLVQDSLVVLADKRDQVENYKAFLFKVLSNKIKQYYDRRARGSWLTGLLTEFDAIPVSTLSTRLSIRVARENDLALAMQKLPLRQYQAFELRYCEGLELTEVADALGVSPATIKRDIERARRTVADVLGDVSDDDELGRIVRSYTRD